MYANNQPMNIPNPFPNIEVNLVTVQQQILAACQATGRDPQSVHLLAVSKRHPAAAIRAAFAAGQRAFGENYLQEAEAKMQQLADLELQWHFIGPLQSNKCKAIAAKFDWVHGIDRLSVAEKLSQGRSIGQHPLQVCIQVNIDQEPSKSGCTEDQLLDLAQQVQTLPGLKLRGLMCIPTAGGDATAAFGRLRHLLETLPAEWQLDTLSMGMSGDMDAAIAQGSTLVRIGTAIFGPRTT